MSDPRNIARRLEQTQVIERPGGVSGLDNFYVPWTAYTPTYTGAATAGVTTYTTQVGAYVRIGSLVVATGTVIWTAATGTGAAQVSLPFTAQNVTNQFFSGSLRIDSVTFLNGVPEMLIAPNTAVFNLFSPVTNAVGANVAVEAAGSIVFTASYFV